MVEHFRTATVHKIGGRAKAMVVTGSRLHAVRYKQAFDKYITEKGYTDIRTLVAFSGTVKTRTPGDEYTEVGMNDGIKERSCPRSSPSDEYQVLLVANKYQTGFDQPLLHTMYVDKRLAGVQAVQTLSRLNRIHAGKEDTFVLDFVNDAEEIQEAFKPYYEVPAVDQQVEPGQLYALQHTLAEQRSITRMRSRSSPRSFSSRSNTDPKRSRDDAQDFERAGRPVRGAGGGRAGTLPEATHRISPVVLVHVADHSLSGRRS